ncbi:MAG: AAA family ATPase [Candidatus Thorarchaeota archaeon]
MIAEKARGIANKLFEKYSFLSERNQAAIDRYDEVCTYLSKRVQELIKGCVEGANSLIIFQTEKLAHHLSETFSSELKELSRKSPENPEGEEGFEISIEFEEMHVDLKCTTESIKTKAKLLSLPEVIFEKKWLVGVLDDLHDKELVEDDEELRRFFASITENIVQAYLYHYGTLGYHENNSHYLPAARSGMIQAYRALAAAYVSMVKYAPVRRFDIPTLPGIVNDFIVALLEMEGKTIPPYVDKVDLGSIIESKILKGSVQLKKSQPMLAAEIVFEEEKEHCTIPLSQASSAISELAPLVLFLRYFVQFDDLLIIEEPEAHLHPDAQRKMACVLANLVNNGIRILVTTHSDYLVHQLSNLIELSTVDSTRLETQNYSQDDILLPKQVSAYLFSCKNEEEGTITRELEISETGIPQKVFAEIAKELYDESVRIQDYKLLNSKTN